MWCVFTYLQTKIEVLFSPENTDDRVKQQLPSDILTSESLYLCSNDTLTAE